MIRRVALVGACLSLMAGILSTAGSSADAAQDGLPPSIPTTGPVWSEISPGNQHTCGIHLDHSLWCWGNNVVGQLGLGDRASRSVPTQVGNDTDWAQLDSGTYYSCATRLDHTL